MSHESERIYRMSLHDKIALGQIRTIIRVPGGWLYETAAIDSRGGVGVSVAFVPFDNEFQNEGQK
jgi:hypothetical protein